MSDVSTPLEIRTFGQFEVYRSGTLLTLDTNRSQKMWDLFKFLVTNRNRTIAPETLIEALWPEEDYDDAKGALRTLVYRLRKALSLDDPLKDLITSVGGGYMFVLTEGCRLDAAEFEHLSAEGRITQDADLMGKAVLLYRGDYLGDTSFLEWTIAKRSYYRRMYIETVCELIEALRLQGRTREADQACEQALLMEPLDENLNVKFLELLMLGGQFSRAQEHYTQFTARLYRELGIKPSPGLKNIYDMIKKQDGHTQTAPQSSAQHEGALFCSPDVFASLAVLESQRGERNNYGVFRADFSFAGQTVTEELQNQAMAHLVRSTRKGDAMTSHEDCSISLLLTGLNGHHIDAVMNRLEGSLAEWSRQAGIEVSASYTRL